MTNSRILAGLLVLAAAVGTGARAAELQIRDFDAYPLVEMSVLALHGPGEEPQVLASRTSLFAGTIERVVRPDSVRLRLTPFVYVHTKNEYEIRPVLVSGLKFAAWRGKSDDPCFSGGFKALFGAVAANYGYRADDGSCYRAWRLSEALAYENHEKRGRRLASLDGWVFAADWAHPTRPATWDLSLLKNCLAVGKTEGKAYGRLLWIPIGQAPPLFQRVPPTEKAGEKPAKEKQPPSSARKRVAV